MMLHRQLEVERSEAEREREQQTQQLNHITQQRIVSSSGNNFISK